MRKQIHYAIVQQYEWKQGKYTATCVCGWMGPDRSKEFMAQRDIEWHMMDPKRKKEFLAALSPTTEKDGK